MPRQPFDFRSRRAFLKNAGLGCGALALTSLLNDEGLLSPAQAARAPRLMQVRQPHFAPKAKAVIWLFMPGSPSQVDTFDYKPELQKRDGMTLEGADPKTGFFTTSGKVLKSPFSFQRHGQSGAWVSEIFPGMAEHVDDMAFIYSCYSQSNNHTPAMLEMNSGMFLQGRPCVGSWVTYGLGSENQNLPGFVVMHGAMPRGGKPIWSPGFLPKVYQPTSIDGGKHAHCRLGAASRHDRTAAASPAGHPQGDEPAASAAAAARSRSGGPAGVVRVGLSHANGRARSDGRQPGVAGHAQGLRRRPERDAAGCPTSASRRGD